MARAVVICIIISLAVFTGGSVMALELKSLNFKNDEFIPSKYTCQGQDISPTLSWSDAPTGTKSFALICDDPDAPVGTWVHWVIYDIAADKDGLLEGVKIEEVLEDGTKQGRNDFGRIGYGGPCPPPGKAHRYFFKLYCLGTMLNLKPGLTKKELLKAMEGHILQEMQLIGLYKR